MFGPNPAACRRCAPDRIEVHLALGLVRLREGDRFLQLLTGSRPSSAGAFFGHAPAAESTSPPSARRATPRRRRDTAARRQWGASRASNSNDRDALTLRARRRGRRLRHDLLERDHEAAHLVGRTHGDAQVFVHRREGTSDHHTLFREFGDDRPHRAAQIHHEEVRLRWNHARSRSACSSDVVFLRRSSDHLASPRACDAVSLSAATPPCFTSALIAAHDERPHLLDDVRLRDAA